MTAAQARAIVAILEEHGAAPVSALAEGGVALVFLRGRSDPWLDVIEVGEDGEVMARRVGARSEGGA